MTFVVQFLFLSMMPGAIWVHIVCPKNGPCTNKKKEWLFRLIVCNHSLFPWGTFYISTALIFSKCSLKQLSIAFMFLKQSIFINIIRVNTQHFFQCTDHIYSLYDLKCLSCNFGHYFPLWFMMPTCRMRVTWGTRDPISGPQPPRVASFRTVWNRPGT